MRKEWSRWKRKQSKKKARHRKARERRATHNRSPMDQWEREEFAVQVAKVGRHLPAGWDDLKRGRYWQWKYKNNVRDKYYDYRHRAEKDGLAWELGFERFCWLIRQSCTYCGMRCSDGVDRSDNSLGYTVDNAVPCDEMCNRMKLHYELSAFIGRVVRIYEHGLIPHSSRVTSG